MIGGSFNYFNPMSMIRIRRQQPVVNQTPLSSKESAYTSMDMGKGSSLGNRNSARMGSLMSVDNKFNQPANDMLGAIRARRFTGMAGGIGGKY